MSCGRFSSSFAGNTDQDSQYTPRFIAFRAQVNSPVPNNENKPSGLTRFINEKEVGAYQRCGLRNRNTMGEAVVFSSGLLETCQVSATPLRKSLFNHLTKPLSTLQGQLLVGVYRLVEVKK